MDDSVELAKKLLGFETVSPLEEKEPLVFLKNVLEEQGIDSEIIQENGVYSLYSEFGGEDKICFNGHIDTVCSNGDWTRKPFQPEIVEGKIYGRGASDMKSGLAAEVMAYIDIFRDPEFSGGASLMVTGDEEIGGFDGTEKLLEMHGEKIKYAVIGEPTGLDIQVGMRGVVWPTIIIEGESVHSSRPEKVDNILEKLPEVLEKLKNVELTYEKPENLEEPTWPVTNVSTAGGTNSIPGKVEIEMDVRTVPSMKPETIRKDIEEAMEETGVEYRVEVREMGKPVTLDDEKFLEKVEQVVGKITGKKPDRSFSGGSSDARFFSAENIPVVEIGPEEETAHMKDEYCSTDKIRELRKIYRETAKELV